MQNIISELCNNPVLICGIYGWALAQILKTVLYALVNRELRLERIVGDGGMPSGHSATVSGMATAAGLIYGLGSFEFAITCMLAVIVLHDAMGVRRETGKQSRVLNEMIQFFQREGLIEAFQNTDKMSEFWENGLKEFVGHTPAQVAAGCLLGILVACLQVL